MTSVFFTPSGGIKTKILHSAPRTGVSAAVFIALGMMALIVSPGCNLYYDVDDAAAVSDDDAGYDAESDSDKCEPESDDELQDQCDFVDSQCDLTTIVDRCGQERDVDCGECPDGYDCEDNQCHCVSPTHQQLCDQRCGILEEVEDHCGETRTFVTCGPCDGEDQYCTHDKYCAPCGEVDCTDKCGLVFSGCGEFVDCSDHPDGVTCDSGQSCEWYECVEGDCEPSNFCASDTCGQIPDGCGDVIHCDIDCGTNEQCINNECVCIPESESELCDNASPSHQCGLHELEDRCGNEQLVDCGQCSGDDVCDHHRCVPEDCAGRDLETDFEHCGSCGHRCDIDEICIDGSCEAVECPEDQGEISDDCDFFDASQCSEEEFCGFMILGSHGSEHVSEEYYFDCKSMELSGDYETGQACSNSDCKPELYCSDWLDNSPRRCARICRRDGHEGCEPEEYCASPFAFHDGSDLEPEREINLEEMGFCTKRCSPYDEDACSSTQRCTAEPAYPEGTCHPNFRCINNGGGTGKSEGDDCDRARLHEDGCPSGLTCAPVGSDGSDICVSLCTGDDSCDEDSQCINAPSPWQALRYCEVN